MVPLYLVQVQGWYRRTCSRCIIHSAPLNTSVLQFFRTTWGGRQQFSCKFRADATPNRNSFALPNARGILLGHAHHMTATQCCQYLLFHEFQRVHSSRPFSLKRYPGREKAMILDNPGPPKPEREYICQNRPFTKPPFYLPVTCRSGGVILMPDQWQKAAKVAM